MLLVKAFPYISLTSVKRQHGIKSKAATLSHLYKIGTIQRVKL